MNERKPYDMPKHMACILIQFVSGKVISVVPEVETITMDETMLYISGERRKIEIKKDKIESIVHIYK